MVNLCKNQEIVDLLLLATVLPKCMNWQHRDLVAVPNNNFDEDLISPLLSLPSLLSFFFIACHGFPADTKKTSKSPVFL